MPPPVLSAGSSPANRRCRDAYHHARRSESATKRRPQSIRRERDDSCAAVGGLSAIAIGADQLGIVMRIGRRARAQNPEVSIAGILYAVGRAGRNADRVARRDGELLAA